MTWSSSTPPHGYSLSRKTSTHPFKERIERFLVENDVAINGMIELELLGGAKTEKEYNRLSSRLAPLYHIEADRSPWNVASKLAFDLKRKGVTVPYTDIFIAASALQENVLLVHADSHFDLIADHSGLRVESFVSFVKE